MPANRETLRRFIAAIVCDLVQHLDNLDDPIIVGGSYPQDLLIKQFRKWCDARNFNVESPDAEGWMTTCKIGSLRMPGRLPVQNEGDSNAST